MAEKYTSIHVFFVIIVHIYIFPILPCVPYMCMLIHKIENKTRSSERKKKASEVNGEYMYFNLRNLRSHPRTLFSFTAIMHKVCINTSKSSKAVLSKQHLSFTYVSTQISILN